MRASIVLLLASLLVVPNVAAADFPEDYTRLLIPVTAVAVPGAHGSVWTTEWTIFNDTGKLLYLVGPFPILFLSPYIQDNEVEPHATRQLTFIEAAPGSDGAFVYVETADLEELPMSLRVRDISVNARSYGTSIPIVRPDAFKGKISLIDIPTDPAYRTMLRIYSAALAAHVVRVAIYAPDSTAPIEEYDVVLQVDEDAGFEERGRPGYAQLDPLAGLSRSVGGKVRVELTASTDPIWAFVSISHNETQQVTTVVP